ncbi:MAG: LPXTG cell wall anchor domain-containing protein [Clostridium sp.]|nr:LPXTG cell wall anchor domain-containing protein [Clostridium sp.]
MPAADQTFTAKWKAAADDDIPATGSASAGLAAFGIISAAAAAAYVITKKKKED